ncbi:MAG: SusC/RagA family TonB-linked outer membrane protein, partial [Rikenellaceae bacterium]
MKKNLTKKVGTLLLSLIGIFLSMQGYAQEVVVDGVVKDSKGEAVIGATVVVAGTNNGSITDFNGHFNLSAKKSDALSVSYIGYITQDVAVKESVIVVLEEDSKSIDEVVVIGYGAVRRKEVTGAVASIASEDLMKSLSTDLGASLQGAVSGVSVTAASDAPGESSTILIRGVTSINGDNTPLYVVDGVPYEDDPLIAPNEIETIDILKDAASCAIYGTRGAAGVILISTKKGSEGKMRVSANASVGVKHIISSTDLMNTVDQTYVNLLQRRAISTSTTYSDMSQTLDLARNPDYFQNNTNLLEDQVYIDFALTQIYNATLSGGTKGLLYSVMAGYTNQEGNVVNTGFDRFNSRVNLNYSRKKLKIDVSAGLSDQTTDITPSNIIVQAIKYYPTQKPLDTEDYVTPGGEEQNRISGILNSFFMEDTQEIYNTFVNYNMSYEIIKDLTVSGRVALSRTNTDRHTFVPYSPIYDSDGDEISTPTTSYVSMTSQKRNSMVWDFGAQYKKEINKHHITALATMTGENYDYVGFTARQEGVVDNDITTLSGTTINPEVSSAVGYTNKLIGTLGRLQYDWDSRYLISASVRVDGSSKFASEN